MTTGKIILLLLAVFIGIPVLVFALGVVFFPAHVINKGVDMAYDITDKTLEADSALYNYEYFKKQKESIDAMYQKLVISQKAFQDFENIAGERKDWTFEDKTEDARLRSVAQGIESQLKDAIADYNAKSKMANRNIFKDGLIPQTMEFSANLIN